MEFREQNQAANLIADQERKSLLRQLTDLGIQINGAATKKLSVLRLALDVAQQMEAKTNKLRRLLIDSQVGQQGAIAASNDYRNRYEHTRRQRDEVQAKYDRLFAQAASLISQGMQPPAIIVKIDDPKILEELLNTPRIVPLKKGGDPVGD